MQKQEEAEQCKAYRNSAHAAYKRADRVARDERAQATRLKSVAELDRRSELFVARSMKQAAEAPQSWGLSKELRQIAIARELSASKKFELDAAQQAEHAITGTHHFRPFCNNLSPDALYTISERRRRTLADELAKVVALRKQHADTAALGGEDASGKNAVPGQPATEIDNDGMPEEDLALQQRQFEQFALNGPAYIHRFSTPHHTRLAGTLRLTLRGSANAEYLWALTSSGCVSDCLLLPINLYMCI